MRAKVNQETAEKRITAKYHKLRVPVIELVQALQDAISPEAVIGKKVEFKQIDGHINVAMTLRARELVLNDGKRKFTLIIEELEASQSPSKPHQ